MANIGIFGGTFNPIHNGHLHIARCFLEQLPLQQIWLMPAKAPTHKAAPDLLSGAHRLAMCHLATAGMERIVVSDLELRRESESYTVLTLEQLTQDYPEHTFYLLMGEDMFCTLLQWKNAARILQLAIPCAAQRSADGTARLEAYGARLQELGGAFRIAQIPYLPVSSTEIRRRLAAGSPISHLVPPAVADYLEQHHFFTGGNHL